MASPNRSPKTRQAPKATAASDAKALTNPTASDDTPEPDRILNGDFTDCLKKYGQDCFAYVAEVFVGPNRPPETLGRYQLAEFDIERFAAQVGPGRYRFDVRMPSNQGCKALRHIHVGEKFAERAREKYPRPASASPAPTAAPAIANAGDATSIASLSIELVRAANERSDRILDSLVKREPAPAAERTAQSPEDALKSALELNKQIGDAIKAAKSPSDPGIPWGEIATQGITLITPLIEAGAEAITLVIERMRDKKSPPPASPATTDEPQQTAPALPAPRKRDKWARCAEVLADCATDEHAEPDSVASVIASMFGDAELEQLVADVSSEQVADQWIERFPALSEARPFVEAVMSAAQEQYADESDQDVHTEPSGRDVRAQAEASGPHQ